MLNYLRNIFLFLWDILNQPLVTEIIGGAILLGISWCYINYKTEEEAEKTKEEVNKRIDKEAENNLKVQKQFYSEKYEIDLLMSIEREIELLSQLTTKIKIDYETYLPNYFTNREIVENKLNEFNEKAVISYVRIQNYLRLLDNNLLGDVSNKDFNDDIGKLLVEITSLKNKKKFPEDQYKKATKFISKINNFAYNEINKKMKIWKN